MLKARHLLFAAVAVLTTAPTQFERTAAPKPRAFEVAAPLLSCDKCEDYGNTHVFSGFGALMDCEAWNSCHGGFDSGWCFDWHFGCGETETADLAVLAQSADPVEVEAYMEAHRGYVYYNMDRAVLQRIGCGGGVTAQYPVSPAVVEALQ
jgi:hypothetical protein